jgi:hypothetical protein
MGETRRLQGAENVAEESSSARRRRSLSKGIRRGGAKSGWKISISEEEKRERERWWREEGVFVEGEEEELKAQEVSQEMGWKSEVGRKEG